MKRKMTYKCHEFIHLGRKGTIEVSNLYPNLFTFTTGFHLHLEGEEWDVRRASRVQKNLRQGLYNYLVKNGINNPEYILHIGAPDKATGKSVFLDLIMTAPNLSCDSNESCEELCKVFMEKFQGGFN